MPVHELGSLEVDLVISESQFLRSVSLTEIKETDGRVQHL